MATNKEIRFSATDTGVSNTMNRIRADSRRLHDDMLRDATEATGSQRDAIKYYEEQIRLIERKNRLETQQARFALRDRYETALSQPGADRQALTQTYQQGLQQIDRGSREDKLQVDLLRDLLEATRETSREEMRHDAREGVEDRMHEERLDRGDDANQSSNEGGFNLRGLRTALGLSTALGQGESGMRGAIDTTAGGLIMSDSAGASLTGLAIKAITDAAQAVSKERKSVHESAMLTGQYVEGLVGGGFGYGGSNRIEEMGLSRDEYLQQYNSSVRSYGKRTNEEQVVRDIQGEKAYGLDQGLTSQMQKLTRVMSQFSETQDITAEVHRSMYGTGAMGEGNMDMARMKDIIGTAISLQESRFQRTGLTTGFEERLSIMRGLEGMGGSFKDDQYKQATMQQLESGVSTTPNKMVHAMKLRKARELFPEQNPFELFASIQSGDPRLIAPLIEDLASSTQDDTLLQQRMYDMFGGQLSAQNVVSITQGIRQGKKVADMLPGQAGQKALTSMTIESRANEGESQPYAEAMKLWNDATHFMVTHLMELGNSIRDVNETLTAP